MSARILVVGDANVDLVLTGDVIPRFGQAEQLLDSANLVVGGSGSIMACGLGRLGVETHMVAVIGDDDFGAFMTRSLEAVGVGTSALTVDPDAATGISVILSTAHDRSILTATGSMSLLRAEHVRAAVESLAPAHVHFASFFLLPELGAELAELLDWLRARGITSSLDTNWDPEERWGGLVEVLERVDVLFPNLEELRAIASAVGVVADTDVSLAAGLGPTVAVKAGAEGGFSVARTGGVFRATGLTVEPVDTTGAGDSFDAGYLAALAEGIADEGMRLRWATICGSLSTLAPGGTTAQPTRVELDRELDREQTSDRADAPAS